jgi:L,D-transpeptidase catalytic domain
MGMVRPLNRRGAIGVVTWMAAGPALAQLPILPDPAQLRPGQFAWQPETAPSGPVLVLVSLTEQVARVYRNGIEIGITIVSSGRPGHLTPTGVFTILQKAKVHHSSTYDEASMPFTERLTWDGVALHAGGVPGYPSSHGCVHLPLAFAQLLFDVTAVGTTVVIADAHQSPQTLVRPGLAEPTRALPPAAEDYVWEPERSATGPLGLLVSIADRRCHVYRNGIEIGQAAASFARPEAPLLPAVFMILDRGPPTDGPVWTEVGLFAASGPVRRSDVLGRLSLPAAFTAALRPELVVGTSLYCALGSATSDTRTGAGFTVVSARPA